jgi:hypothetical protein
VKLDDKASSKVKKNDTALLGKHNMAWLVLDCSSLASENSQSHILSTAQEVEAAETSLQHCLPTALCYPGKNCSHRENTSIFTRKRFHAAGVLSNASYEF